MFISCLGPCLVGFAYYIILVWAVWLMKCFLVGFVFTKLGLYAAQESIRVGRLITFEISICFLGQTSVS